ncbi:MAG: alpha/beta hydrolase [Candidatus Omnitrophica bacterium]|jgi:pimeloyl-ACP methyl ester carboxylesterase|nr:alpha/beta hydrolase [Candidatus Omnitrophota bacterium]
MKKALRRIGILGVVVIAASLVWLQFGLNNRVAVSKDGVKIIYSVYGKGEPALVFVHGWCGSRGVWYKQVPYFAKKYKVITLDLAGYGKSGRQRKAYTQEAFGEDVAAVVNAAGAGKVILIGHSMSGTIILEANRLIKDKVIGLVAIDTLENFEYMATAEDKIKYIEPLKKDFVKNSGPFMRDMFNKNADPKLVELVVRNVARSNPGIAINTMEYYFDTPVIPLLADVNVPLWCLSADLWQQYQHPEINSKYLKSYHLRIMPGVGHFLMVESPDEFNRQLEDIIYQIIKQEK